MNKFSFQRGWSQVRRCDMPAVKQELMDALNINSRNSFYERTIGKIEPRVSEHNAIEAIFKKYGITDVWGEAVTPGYKETKLSESA